MSRWFNYVYVVQHRRLTFVLHDENFTKKAKCFLKINRLLHYHTWICGFSFRGLLIENLIKNPKPGSTWNLNLCFSFLGDIIDSCQRYAERQGTRLKKYLTTRMWGLQRRLMVDMSFFCCHDPTITAKLSKGSHFIT